MYKRKIKGCLYFNRNHFCGLVAVGFLTSCHSGKIERYQVKKESPQLTTTSSFQPASLTYQAPKTWKEQSVEGMRKASFQVENAEVSVISLPGAAGGLLENLNRWRGQVGLPPVDEETAQKMLIPVKVDGQSGFHTALFSPEKDAEKRKGMLVTLVQTQGQSWFFKVLGPANTVEKQKDNFDTFLASIHFSSPDTRIQQPLATSSDESKLLKYKVPSAWQEQPAQGMRVASFTVVEAGESADISVIPMAGDVGGLNQNVNRWREQIGLNPQEQDKIQQSLAEVQIGDVKGNRLTIYNTENHSGMIVALATRQDKTWFIKMSGSQKIVKSQESNFANFIQSIQFLTQKEAK